MKLYQLLHANERPIDLTNTPAFENTENLRSEDKINDVIYLRSKKFTEDEIAEKI